jgi:hypothetical protein
MTVSTAAAAAVDVLQRIAAGLTSQGLRVDSTVTLACGDVLWAAEHKLTRVR